MRNSECKIQNAKCKHCITDSHSKLRLHDYSAENTGHLIRFALEILQVVRRSEAERSVNPQPVQRLARLAQRDFNVADEFTLRRRSLGLLEISADRGRRL